VVVAVTVAVAAAVPVLVPIAVTVAVALPAPVDMTVAVLGAVLRARRLIHGFYQTHEVEQLIKNTPPGTFILRFCSNSNFDPQGALAVTVSKGDDQVPHLSLLPPPSFSFFFFTISLYVYLLVLQFVC
jgi:hypothetical protein